MFNLCQVKVCTEQQYTYLTNLNTWNLHRKVEYISQPSENSFSTQPQIGHDSIHMFFYYLFAYLHSIT